MVLTIVAEGGELLEDEAVEEFANGFLPRLQGQLDALFGLVFRDQRTLGDSCILVGIPDSLLKSIPLPDSHRGRLRAIMKPVSVGLLRAFANELDLDLSDTRKPVLANAIRKALLCPTTLREYLDKLKEDRWAVLDLFLSKKTVTRHEVAKQLGESAARELEDMLWKAPLFYAHKGNLTAPNTTICLAPDLHSALARVAQSQGGQLESQLDDLLVTTTVPPTSVHDNTAHLIQDLATLLGIVERRLPRRLKRGGIPKGDLREAAKFCHGQGDPGYIEFLTLFLETAGLVEANGSLWQTARDAGDRLDQTIDTRKACYAFWLQTDRWNEWSADRTSAPAASTRMQELKNIRTEIVRSLQQCPANTWITYPSYYHFLTRLSESFRHFAENPASGRNLAAGGTTADELLRRVISGALTWMGVLRVGDLTAFAAPLHKSERPVFQITTSGSALLNQNNDEALCENIPPQNPNAKFVLQPNFEVLVPPDLSYTHYLKLCGLSDLKTQDVMTCFDLSQDSIRHAFTRGFSGSDLRTFFTQHSATGLPHMVESLIEECENKYGEIEIIPSIGFLKVNSPELLDELYAQPRIARVLKDRLSPTIAPLYNATKPESLVQILHQQGYMPHLAQEEEAGNEDHHQIVFTTSELSELVAYLDVSSEMLLARTEGQLEELSYLISRLKRPLRRAPYEPRQQAEERYRQTFEQRKPDHREGLEDLLRYAGTNPATESNAMRTLIGYAINHQLRVEIAYGSSKGDGHRIIEPFSEDLTMLYAFCQTRRGDRVFRLDKIFFARLTGERFQRAG
jgi:hypothetical protein